MFFGYMPKSNLAESWRSIPNFPRNCHIDFYRTVHVCPPTSNGVSKSVILRLMLYEHIHVEIEPITLDLLKIYQWVHYWQKRPKKNNGWGVDNSKTTFENDNVFKTKKADIVVVNKLSGCFAQSEIWISADLEDRDSCCLLLSAEVLLGKHYALLNHSKSCYFWITHSFLHFSYSQRPQFH